VEAARLIFEEDPCVGTVCEVLSMQLGPDEILMAATLDFNDDMTTPQLEDATDNLTKKLRAADPRITRVFLRPGRALT
jgi:divalent metal cation (Fe/Co/Zn/Cd) transporter